MKRGQQGTESCLYVKCADAIPLVIDDLVGLTNLTAAQRPAVEKTNHWSTCRPCSPPSGTEAKRMRTRYVPPFHPRTTPRHFRIGLNMFVQGSEEHELVGPSGIETSYTLRPLLPAKSSSGCCWATTLLNESGRKNGNESAEIDRIEAGPHVKAELCVVLWCV